MDPDMYSTQNLGCSWETTPRDTRSSVQGRDDGGDRFTSDSRTPSRCRDNESHGLCRDEL